MISQRPVWITWTPAPIPPIPPWTPPSKAYLIRQRRDNAILYYQYHSGYFDTPTRHISGPHITSNQDEYMTDFDKYNI